MPGPAPKPKEQRRRRNAPASGEYQKSEAVGWQHGPVPPCPAGLLKSSRTAWHTWMTSWVAAHWLPSDLPALRQVISLFDQVERGEYLRTSALAARMDAFGLTPRGQQALRWARPNWVVTPAQEEPAAPEPEKAADPYSHLRIVGGD